MGATKFQLKFIFGAEKASSVDKAFQSINKSIGSLVKGAAAFAATKISVSSIQNAVDTYAGFEQSMANVQALSGAAGETFQAMKDKALEMGKKTSKTAQDAADALGYMSLAGWDANTSMEALEPVLHLSEAGQLDLARTSDLVTDSMSAFGLKAEDLTGYLDAVAQTSRRSNTSIEQMMEAYNGVGGVLHTLGVPLDEASTALGVLANSNVKGSEAGTGLSAVISNLTTGTGQAGKAMKALGLSAFDSMGNFKGIKATLTELHDKTKDMSKKQRNYYLSMIGGKNQIKTLNALMAGLTATNEQGAVVWDALNQEIQTSKGALNEMAGTMNNTMKGAFAHLASAADDFKINVVSAFAPDITAFIETLASKIPKATEVMSAGLMKGVKWMKLLFMTPKNEEDRAQFILNMSELTGLDATKAGQLQNLMEQGFSGKAAGIMELMGMNPETIQRITGLIDSIVDKIGQVKIGAQKVYDWFKPALSWLTDSGLPMVVEGFLSVTDGLIGFISDVANNWEANGPIIMGFIGGLAGLLVIQKVGSAISGLVGALSMVASPAGIVVMAIGAIIAAGIYLYENWDSLMEAASNLKEWFMNALGGLGEWFSNLLGGIADTFTGFINFFIKGINWIIGGLNKISFTTPDWLPGNLGGKTFGFHIPEIPLLAQGGIATAPTLAMVGEGKESEAILPLSKLQGFMQTNMLQEITPVSALLRQLLNANTPNRETVAAPIQYTANYYITSAEPVEGIQKAFREESQNMEQFLREREEQIKRTSLRRRR